MIDHSFGVAFLSLFDLNGLLAFIGGVLATFVVCWVRDRMADKSDPASSPHRTRFRSLLLLWMMVYIVVGYIAIQQEGQQLRVQALSAETIRCQKEFLQQLRARSEAGDDTDKWSAIKTKALSDWMHELLMPPGEIADRRARDPKDPVVQQWGLQITAHYDGIIQEAEQQQEASLAERAQHPLPEATCGK